MSSRYSEAEIKRPTSSAASWHDDFSKSPYIYVGGLPYDVDEHDITTVFSQYGEVIRVNLAKEPGTGKSKGFAFLAYENPKSALLAVDNFDGIELLGRRLKVDHTHEFREPKTSVDRRHKE